MPQKYVSVEETISSIGDWHKSVSTDGTNPVVG